MKLRSFFCTIPAITPHNSILFIEWFVFILAIYLEEKACYYMPYIVNIFFLFFLWWRNKLTQSMVGPSEQILKEKMLSPQKEIATANGAHENAK